MSAPRVVLLSCLMVAIGLSGCSKQDEKGQGGPRAGGTPVPVTATDVGLSDWNDTLQALGTAKARESVTVTAKVSELIDQVHFDSGQLVAKGQPLVTLRGDSQQAALAQARATFAEADQLYRRQAELAAQQLVARSTLDSQKAIRDAAEARVRQAQSDIGDRHVRAPFAGVMGIRQVSPGALVSPTTVIATLDDISRVHVDFQVPEADLASIRPGDRVAGSNVAYPGREFEGRVSTIDARVDPASRAVTVRADFPNPDRALRPGMLVEVRIYRPQRKAMVIPEIAVTQVGRDSYVWRLDADNKVEQLTVRTGARRAGVVEIIEGLKVGERIIVDGTGKVRPGQAVAPQPADPVPAGVAPDAGQDDRQHDAVEARIP